MPFHRFTFVTQDKLNKKAFLNDLEQQLLSTENFNCCFSHHSSKMSRLLVILKEPEKFISFKQAAIEFWRSIDNFNCCLILKLNVIFNRMF